jgi:hypothetical protein
MRLALVDVFKLNLDLVGSQVNQSCAYQGCVKYTFPSVQGKTNLYKHFLYMWSITSHIISQFTSSTKNDFGRE